MEDFVNSGNISINKERCIRTTFSKSHCRDCENICIVDAIIFSPTPSINKNLCIKCGLCYASCKFSAINMKKNNEEMLRSLTTKQNINTGCIFADAEVKITCLSRITEDLLIHWFLDEKNINLKKGFCKTCKFKDSLKYFKESLKKSIIIAKALGITPNIKIKSERSEKVYIPKESISRRNMFSGLGITQKKSASKRKLLVNSLEHEIKNDVPYPDSANIKIDKTCTLCGVCEHVCPTKAINIKKHENKGYIYFYPSLCVVCSACTESCLYDSITVVGKTVSFITSKPKKVFEATKKVCKNCGKEFYTQNSDEQTCYTCRLKENDKKQLIDFLKDL